LRTLRVHPNPYILGTVDHLGRPAGRVRCDYYEHAKTGFVGAQLTDFVEVQPAVEQRMGGRTFVHSQARHDHRVTYSKVAVEIPNTAYYRDAIKRGDLFAADKKTWVACGGAAASFVEPKEALAKAKAEAIEHFDAATGEDAHKEMGAFEPIWIGDEAPAAPAAAAKQKPADASKGSAQ